MTPMPFHVEPNLVGFVEPPPTGTLSRTLHADESVRVVVFGFAEGEELTEHASSRPALLQVLRGELELTLDGESVRAREGAWVQMSAGLRHAIRARTPAVMLLTLVQQGGAPPGG